MTPDEVRNVLGKHGVAGLGHEGLVKELSELSTSTQETRSILEEAQEIIHGQRREDYGKALDSFDKISRMWSVILETEVVAEHVVLCMIALKVCRASHGITSFQRDSYVDIAGYAGCGELVERDRTFTPGYRKATRTGGSS